MGISKINIASLASDFGLGGVARQIVTIDKYLNRDIFEHFVISLNSANNTRLGDIKNAKILYARNAGEVVDLLRKYNIHVLYVHRHGRNEPQHDEIAKLLDDKISVVEMNNFSAFDPGLFGKRIDKNIFVSKTSVLKYCIQNNLPFDARKYKAIYIMVDSNNFLSRIPSQEELNEYKNKLGIMNSFVVGRIARPVMEKWDDITSFAWKRLCKMNPNIKFLIYGVPMQKRELLRKMGIEKNLVIMEPTSSDSELSCFYSSIDVLLHASPIGECSCGTIAEAMLFKKPVVVTSTPFPRFVLGRNHTHDNGQLEQIKNGENGYVVKNSMAMAMAINSLYNNRELLLKMGEKNYSDLMKKFDVGVVMKVLEKLFIESVLEKHDLIDEKILVYNSTLKSYPDSTETKNWFIEYYQALKDVYGNELHDTIIDRINLLYIKYSAKSANLLKKMLPSYGK